MQTQTTVETARGNVASYESQVQRDRNALTLLVCQTVLDAQRALYAAQQALIALQLTEQSNRVTLYKVLGGG